MNQQSKGLEVTEQKWEGHRLQRCPYWQHLKIFCAEVNCARTDCPIWLKESGLLAEALKGGR